MMEQRPKANAGRAHLGESEEEAVRAGGVDSERVRGNQSVPGKMTLQLTRGPSLKVTVTTSDLVSGSPKTSPNTVTQAASTRRKRSSVQTALSERG